jgi:hypothetical protein
MTVVLNRVKVLINSLNPNTRGEQVSFDDVKVELKDLKPLLEQEQKDLLGGVVSPLVRHPDGTVVPDSASSDYVWASEQIDAALKGKSEDAVATGVGPVPVVNPGVAPVVPATVVTA